LCAHVDRDEIAASLGTAVQPVLAESVRAPRTGDGVLDLAPAAISYDGSSSLARFSALTPAALLQHCTSLAASAAISAPLCIVQMSDPVALLGAAHAVAGNKRLAVVDERWHAPNLAESVSRARSIVFVVSASACARNGWDFFFELLRDAGLTDPALASWGILTAATPAGLAELVSRIALHVPSNDYRAQALSTMPIFPGSSSTLRHVEVPSTPSAVVARVLTTELTPLSYFLGHGRPYCALGGNLCTLPSRAAAGDDRCIGDFDCVFASSERSPTNAIRSAVVVVESCCAASFLKTGSAAATVENIGLGLLDGYAVAVISPYRTQVQLPVTPSLAWRLARAGCTAGDICAALNAAVSTRSGETGRFVVLGDPDATVYAAPHLPPREARVRALGDGRWRIEAPASAETIELYRCDDARLAAHAAASSLHVCCDEREDEPARLEFLRRNDGALGILAVWRTPPSGAQCWIVTDRPPLRRPAVAAAAQVLDSVRAETRHADAAWNDFDRRPVDELDALLRLLESTFYANLGSDTPSHGLYAALASMQDRIGGCGLRIARGMADVFERRAWADGFWAFRHYATTSGVRFHTSEPLPEPCFRCGAGVIALAYDAGVGPVRTRRLLECERCMFLSDVPCEAAPLFITGPATATQGEPFVLALEGKNDTSEPVLAVSRLAFDCLDHRDRFDVRAAGADRWIEPFQRFSFPFSVTVSNGAPAHLYNAQGFVLLNGILLWSLGKVTVVDASTRVNARARLTQR
jgi:hypothetical protein